MILSIIIIIICVLSPVIVQKIRDDDDDNCYSLFAIVSGFLGFFIFLIILSAPASPDNIEDKLVKTTIIYSVGNDIGVNGRFVLGFGNVDAEMYYFYYEKNETGIVVSKLNSQNVTLVERDDDEQIAYLEEYKTVFKNEDWFLRFGKDVWGCRPKYIIKLPKGAIKYSFNISLS